ncbi:MAG: hypothetical protein SOW41_05980 [Anaerococcus sp.]|nr:hypothetical protein [Peptoniphilaceae bacterium]MDY3055599.1 hypothetical protein [Anaerococcus sp.]
MRDKDREEIERLIYSMKLEQLNILIAFYEKKKKLSGYQWEFLKMAKERKFLLTHQNDVVLRRRK